MDAVTIAPRPVVGVVGLGRMGASVLGRIAEHNEVVAHDLAVDRARVAAAHGARWCASASDLAASVDVLVTVLPGPVETAAVLREALPALRAGAAWVDLGSGDPETTAVLAEEAADRKVQAVSAPMGGGVDEARAGALLLFIGGDEAAVARVRPILERLARRGGMRMCGPRPSDGQVVKLLANALWFAHAVAAAEALLVGQAHGLAPVHLLGLLQGSAGGSVALSQHLPGVLSGDYLPVFGIDRVVEELRAVRGLGETGGVTTAVLDASADVHDRALARFGPELGELLGVRLLEEEAGRDLR